MKNILETQKVNILNMQSVHKRNYKSTLKYYKMEVPWLIIKYIIITKIILKFQ